MNTEGADSGLLRDEKIFWVVFVSLLIGHVGLIWLSRLLPFVDLPDHLATATIIRYYSDTTNHFKEYYSLGSFFAKPNLFHVLFCSLKIFPSVEWANRLYYSICVVSLPILALLIIRKLKGNVYFSLSSFLLTYNLNTCWGFAGFTLAIPLLLAIVLVYLHVADRPGFLWLCLPAAMLVLMFLVHVLMAVFALGLYCLFLVFSVDKPRKELIKQALVVVPIIALIIFWWSERAVSEAAGKGFVAPLLSYYWNDYIPTLWGRSRLLVLDNYALYPGAKGYGIAALFFLVIVWPLLLRPRETAAGLARLMEGPAKYAALMAGFSLACFVFLPDRIFNFQILYQRFSSIFLLGAIILSGLLFSRLRSRFCLGLTAFAAILHFALWAGYFYDFNSQNAHFDKAFFPKDSVDRTLGAIVYDIDFRGKPIYVHMPSYYIVWTKGIATFRIVDFVDFAPPLRRLPVGRPIPEYKEWEWSGKSNPGDYLALDYLLVRGDPGRIPNEYTKVFKLEKERDRWLLLKTTLEDKRSGKRIQGEILCTEVGL
jgi:hypothetical protein